jgi:polyisoprenoid-binding protein YceI
MKAMKVLLLTVWVLAIQIQTVQGQMFSVKSYKLSVKGTSSLHDWESAVDKLEGKGSFVLANNVLSDIRDVVVKIPVKSIKSTKGKMMDNKTWEAFNHDKNPTITFTLTDKKINAPKTSLVANGTLTMAGVTKPVELHLNYKILPGGELQISGTHRLLMSDFNMEAPTAMMGTIKVGDEVFVNLEMILLNVNSTL